MASADTDFYSDDPVEDSHSPSKKKFSSILAFLMLLVGGTYLVQTTLAANISLNTGAPVEFGQGITATAACSGATDLTITPYSSFTNASGAGAFYISSVKVSNIPTSCYGVDFTINAYDNTSSSPLALFNSSSTSAIIYNNAGTFELGINSTGMTVVGSPGTFTVTFTTPVALASSIFKITIQSGAHAVPPTVGQTGPGGGTIFYYSAAGFNCGSGFSATGSPTGGKCNYLEAAPSTWSGGADPTRSWATGGSNQTNSVPAGALQTAIGTGYQNSDAIVAQTGNIAVSSAAVAARAYRGGSKSDWYLPSKDELNQMCKWQKGVAWTSDATVCTGGTLNSGTGAAGFANGNYWSSTEAATNKAWKQHFFHGTQDDELKSTVNSVRPIRAF